MALNKASLSGLVLSNFQAHQRRAYEDESKVHGRRSRGMRSSNMRENDVAARVSLIRDEIASHLLTNAMSAATVSEGGEKDDMMQDAKIEVAAAIAGCVDAAFGTIASHTNTASWSESVEQVFDLASSLACYDGDGFLAGHLVLRATQFSVAPVETVRAQSCVLLGLCVRQILLGAEQSKSTELGKTDVSSFLVGSSESMEWREECIDVVRESLLPRLTDKSQAVRNAAIKACASFFNDIDEEKEANYTDISDALIYSLTHDPSFANRSAAVQSVPVSEAMLPHILERVRDVKLKVRVDALDVLRAKVDVHDLTEDQRVELLEAALTPRCTSTYEATAKMLCCGWMKSVKFDPIALLGLLSPTVNDTICEKTLACIIDAASNDETKSISVKATLKELSDPEVRAYKEEVFKPLEIVRGDSDAPVDAETAFFLRVMCDKTLKDTSLSDSRKADTIGKLMPDVPVLCEILQKRLGLLVGSIRSHCEGQDEEVDDESAEFEDSESFICLQLLHLFKLSDLKEEGSRRHFISIMQQMLSSLETPDELIEESVRAITVAHDTEAQFLQTVSEILSDVTESSSDTEDDDVTASQQLRSVTILSVVLENTSRKMSSNSVMLNFSSYVLSAVTNKHPVIREAGVSCLGKFALLSNQETVVTDFKPLLLKIAGNDNEKVEVRAQALLALSDLTLLFEDMLSPCPPGPDEEVECASFLSLVERMLASPKLAMVVIAAEITIKLLFSGKLNDGSMLAQLLMIFFDKDFVDVSMMNEESDEVKEVGSPVRLQQLLSLFFPAYSMKNKHNRDTLIGSIKPLLSLVDAKLSKKVRGRKVTTWPISKMIDYICSTVDMGEEQDACKNVDSESETNTEESSKEETSDSEQVDTNGSITVGLLVSEFMVLNSSSLTTSYLRALCKIIASLYIDEKSGAPFQLAVLKNQLEELAMLITDDSALQTLEPQTEKLASIQAAAESDVEDELIEGMESTNLEDEEEPVANDDDEDTRTDEKDVNENQPDLSSPRTSTSGKDISSPGRTGKVSRRHLATIN